jgi:hypothetical protein
MYLNGLMLDLVDPQLSDGLDFELGNDLPYVLHLPDLHGDRLVSRQAA